MSNKKIIDIKSLSKELESLIDISANSCGPMLIKELQKRIDKTADVFNKDVEQILLFLFDRYHDREARCKKKLSNNKPSNDDFGEEETVSPKFIGSSNKENKL